MRFDNNHRIFDDKNKCVGYVENEELFAIDQDGYAVLIGKVDSNAQALGRLRKWLKK